MRDATEQDVREAHELVQDTAVAVAAELHKIAERFLPRVRALHLRRCEQPTHPEGSILQDAEMNVVVAAGVVLSMLLQGMPPETAQQVARVVSTMLGGAGAVTFERAAPATPKARA